MFLMGPEALRQCGGVPQRVFDEHGVVLDLRDEIWSDGFSHGHGGMF
jgi:hypothetical protein